MKDPLDFTGKVVLVTGSSRGIGAEMIRAFGTLGAQCVVNYVADAQEQNKADALGVAKELNEPLVIECDVTQTQQVEAMMKQIQNRRGGLDILVNNSGIISDRTIKKMSLDEFDSLNIGFVSHTEAVDTGTPMGRMMFGVIASLAEFERSMIAERITACRDPTDDKFLELAVNGGADLIVSGDGDLLALNPFRDIPIVTPAAFVQGVAR